MGMMVARGTRPATALQDIGKRTRLKSSFDSPIVMCTANSLMTGEAKTMITTRFSEEL